MSTIGAYLIALSILVFIINFFVSARAAKKAGSNPWEAPTLEWATSSPPPDYNFAKIPTLTRTNPLWDEHPDSGH